MRLSVPVMAFSAAVCALRSSVVRTIEAAAVQPILAVLLEELVLDPLDEVRRRGGGALQARGLDRLRDRGRVLLAP